MENIREYLDFIIFVEQLLLGAFLIVAMVKIRRLKKERNRSQRDYWEMVGKNQETLAIYYALKAKMDREGKE